MVDPLMPPRSCGMEKRWLSDILADSNAPDSAMESSVTRDSIEIGHPRPIIRPSIAWQESTEACREGCGFRLSCRTESAATCDRRDFLPVLHVAVCHDPHIWNAPANGAWHWGGFVVSESPRLDTIPLTCNPQEYIALGTPFSGASVAYCRVDAAKEAKLTQVVLRYAPHPSFIV